MHRLALPVLLALCCARAELPALAPQGPGELPRWRVGEVAGALGDRDLARALTAALNSPDDQLRVWLEGELTIALGAGLNGGVRQGLAAEVRRTDGGFEVAISRDAALNVGVEAYQGLEVQAGAGAAAEVLFAWDSPAETARGLRLLTNAHEVALGSFVSMVEAQLEVVRQSAEALREAVTRTAAAQDAYRGLAFAHRRAHAALDDLRRDLGRAHAAVASLERRVAAAARRVDRLPRFLRGPARAVLRALQRSLREDGAVARSMRAALTAAERTAAGAQRALDGARDALDHAFRQEDAARRMHTAAREVADGARDFANAVHGATAELVRHLRGVEFTARTGAEASAAVHPAGIQLENVGMGASAGTFLGATVGYRIRGSGEELRVVGAHDVELAAWAGMGVGARTEWALTTSIEARWQRGRGARGYVFDDVATTVALDASALAVVGAGVAVRHGVGALESLTLDAAQWRETWRRLSGMDPTPAGLIAALRGIPCTASSQARWIGQVVASGGASYAGTGFGIEVGASWDDAGTAHVRHTDAGSLLDELLSAGRRIATAADLERRL